MRVVRPEKYLFKVQVSLGINVETVFIRVDMYVNKSVRSGYEPGYFNKFRNDLIHRYDILGKIPFNIMWIDSEGDKINIINEDDLRICTEMKATKLYIEANESDLRVNSHPSIYSIFQCKECNGLYNQTSRTNNMAAPNFNLCDTCKTKKLLIDHMMLSTAKPLLDHPRNLQFLDPKEPHNEGKEKESRPQSHHNRHNVFEDIVTDAAKNVATATSATQSRPQASSNKNTDNAAQGSGNKSAENDVKQIELITDTLCEAFSMLIKKSGIVKALTSSELESTQLEMAVTLEPRKCTKKTNNNILQRTAPAVLAEPRKCKQSEELKSNESENTVDIPESQSTLLSESIVVMIPILSAAPTSNDIAIENETETLAANVNNVEHRDSSPIPEYWPDVDVKGGHVEGDQSKYIATAPKLVTAPVLTPDSLEPVDVDQVLPMCKVPRPASVPKQVTYHPNNHMSLFRFK